MEERAREARRAGEAHPQAWPRGDPLPPIDGQQAWEAIGKYRNRTGAGRDRPHPRPPWQLPRSYADRPAEALNLWEAQASTMDLWSMVTAFLPKRSSSDEQRLEAHRADFKATVMAPGYRIRAPGPEDYAGREGCSASL